MTQPVIFYDRYRLSIRELLQGLLMGAAFGTLAAYTFYRSLFAYGLMLPMVVYCPVMLQRAKKEERKHRLKLEFKEGALILASSISAGLSVENAINTSLSELRMLYGEEGLICREFAYISHQLRTNRTVEDCLMELGIRSGIEDIQNFAEVFTVAKRGGADLGEILRYTANVIRDKIQVDEEILTMTASKRFEQKIMMGIPFFIVFYIDLSSPGFFTSMYHTAVGKIMMTICLGVYVLSGHLSRRILSIEV